MKGKNMNIGDTVTLLTNSNKIGSIVTIEPMLQVKFNNGETCWHKESELTTVRETPVGTWLKNRSKPPYYALVLKSDRQNKLHEVVWFIFSNGQFQYHSQQSLCILDMNLLEITPCPTLVKL